MDSFLPLGILLLLVALSALAAGAEIALLSLSLLRLEAEARKGNALARLQLALRRQPQRMLTTILIIGNLLNAGLTVYAAVLCTDILAPLLGLSREQALLLNTVVVAAVIIVICDLIPKTMGAVRPEPFAALITLPVVLFDKLFTPIHWLMGFTVTPLLRLLTGGQNDADRPPTLEEVRTMLSMAHAGGQVHLADAQVAQEALRFSSRDLEDVMTPRVDVIAVPDSASVGEAMTLMMESGFSRLPVYHEDIDEITGVLLLKDLVKLSLERARDGHDPEDRWAAEPVRPLLRSVVNYPGSKSVVEALAELRRERTHLAVVVDEHGGTAGIVTLEDILEELVGDIQDESDSAHSADVMRRSGGVLIVTGRARLDSIPELEAVELGETEASTLGGLLMERLGRPAVVNDSMYLPPKEGYVNYSAGNGSGPGIDADAESGGAADGGSSTPRGLRVTALKVLRTRIKLLRVEPAEGE